MKISLRYFVFVVNDKKREYYAHTVVPSECCTVYVYAYMYVYVCDCVCARASVRVSTCMRACVRAYV